MAELLRYRNVMSPKRHRTDSRCMWLVCTADVQNDFCYLCRILLGGSSSIWPIVKCIEES